VSTVAKNKGQRLPLNETVKPPKRRRSVTRRQLLIGTLLVIAVIAGSVIIWRRVQRHVASQPEYQVAIEDVEITPQPQWIHADIKADVIRDAGLKKKISILDDSVPQRISDAFALNPWVESVAGVHTSYPARIKVDLVYRRPVAMVAVPGGLLPIDSQGILLPTAGFSAAEAQSYPRIAGINSIPQGLVGTPWGDASVERAAKLAILLQDDWQSLRLRQIEVSAADMTTPGVTSWQIVTRGGTAFIWGAAPGEETDQEAKAPDKLAKLRQLATDLTSLDAATKPQLDLRQPAPAH
jgi:cell division septal protein FtsQ